MQTLIGGLLQGSRATLDSIRLWDWRALAQTYSQLQEMRLYYKFPDVDVDRYMVDGKYRQVMLAAREIEIERQPVKTWVNTHLQYTHGYGVVMSPVNEATDEGLPNFFISDIPQERGIRGSPSLARRSTTGSGQISTSSSTLDSPSLTIP